MMHQVKGCQHCICKSDDSTIGIANNDVLLRHLIAIDKAEHAVREISTFIGMLSDYYKKDKEEGLKFE